MEHVRAEAYWLRGRCALARAASDRKGRDDLLREVVDCARRLERERVRWAKSVAGFLYAGVYALRGAGQTSDQYVGAAVRAAEAASLGLMTLLATGASPLPSTSAPGEQPSLLVQIVARPDRWRAMLLPGL